MRGICGTATPSFSLFDLAGISQTRLQISVPTEEKTNTMSRSEIKFDRLIGAIWAR